MPDPVYRRLIYNDASNTAVATVYVCDLECTVSELSVAMESFGKNTHHNNNNNMTFLVNIGTFISTKKNLCPIEIEYGMEKRLCLDTTNILLK